MQPFVIALAACVVAAALVALAYLGIPDKTLPDTTLAPSPTPQIYAPSRPGGAPPSNAKGPCAACTDEGYEVCKGPKRWRNHCHAYCEGEYDVQECTPRPPEGCGASGPRYKCYDNPLAVVQQNCRWQFGFDERFQRDCTPAEEECKEKRWSTCMAQRAAA